MVRIGLCDGDKVCKVKSGSEGEGLFLCEIRVNGERREGKGKGQKGRSDEIMGRVVDCRFLGWN